MAIAKNRTASEIQQIMTEYKGVVKKSDFNALLIALRCLNILILGECGVGKTWTMKKLISHLECTEEKKIGLVRYRSNGRGVNVIGKYTGKTFDGSDALSMTVMNSLDLFLRRTKQDKLNVYEGQRFSNMKFIKKTKCLVFKIDGDGLQGRIKRMSEQKTTHLKRIASQVRNLEDTVDKHFKCSQDCYDHILSLLEEA